MLGLPRRSASRKLIAGGVRLPNVVDDFRRRAALNAPVFVPAQNFRPDDRFPFARLIERVDDLFREIAYADKAGLHLRPQHPHTLSLLNGLIEVLKDKGILSINEINGIVQKAAELNRAEVPNATTDTNEKVAETIEMIGASLISES